MYRVSVSHRHRVFHSIRRNCTSKAPGPVENAQKTSKVVKPTQPPSSMFGTTMFFTTIVAGGLAYQYSDELEKIWKGVDKTPSLPEKKKPKTPEVKAKFTSDSEEKPVKPVKETAIVPAKEPEQVKPVVIEPPKPKEEPKVSTPPVSLSEKIKNVPKLEAKVPEAPAKVVEPVVIESEPVVKVSRKATEAQVKEVEELKTKLKRLQTQKLANVNDARTKVTADVKKEVELFHGDLEKSILAGVTNMDTTELRMRLVELVAELKSRSKLESFRLTEAIRKVEDEANAKNLEVVAKQADLHDAVLKKELKLKEEAIREDAEKQKQELRAKFTSTMTKALQEQKDKLENEYKSSLESEAKAIEANLQQQLTKEINELNQVHLAERADRIKVLDDLRLQLNALNAVLDSRSVYESFSHQVHKVSVAALALSNQIEASAPLHAELTALRNAGRGDDFIEAVLASFPVSVANQGAPTTSQLLNRFQNVRKVGRQAAMMPKESGMLGHLFGSILAKLTVAPIGPVEGNDAEAVFARATHFLEKGDLESAVKQVEQLSDYPAEIASDWLQEARSRLLVEQAAKVVKAHVSLLAASCS